MFIKRYNKIFIADKEFRTEYVIPKNTYIYVMSEEDDFAFQEIQKRTGKIYTNGTYNTPEPITHYLFNFDIFNITKIIQENDIVTKMYSMDIITNHSYKKVHVCSRYGNYRTYMCVPRHLKRIYKHCSAKIIQNFWRSYKTHKRIREEFNEWLYRSGNPGYYKTLNHFNGLL